jgi:hypothetical protein
MCYDTTHYFLLYTLHNYNYMYVQLYTYIIHVPGTEEEDYYYLGVHTLPWYMVLYNLQSTIYN